MEQVVAMEAKAKEIGKGGELYYLFPSGGQTAPGPSMVHRPAFSHEAIRVDTPIHVRPTGATVCRKCVAEDCSLGRRAGASGVVV